VEFRNKIKVIPVTIGATGTISKSLKQYMSYIPEKHEVNSLNSELNPICHLLALVGAHPIFHVSRIRVKKLQTTAILCTAHKLRKVLM
jgi:hypothetical protein